MFLNADISRFQFIPNVDLYETCINNHFIIQRLTPFREYQYFLSDVYHYDNLSLRNNVNNIDHLLKRIFIIVRPSSCCLTVLGIAMLNIENANMFAT